MSAIARSADGLSVRWEMICSKISCGKIGRSVGVLGLVVRVEVAERDGLMAMRRVFLKSLREETIVKCVRQCK